MKMLAAMFAFRCVDTRSERIESRLSLNGWMVVRNGESSRLKTTTRVKRRMDLDGWMTDATTRWCDRTSRLTNKNIFFLQVLDFKSADESYRYGRLNEWMDCARWLAVVEFLNFFWFGCVDGCASCGTNRTRTGAFVVNE